MADVLEVEHALCTFTTGSTGLPKPVMRTHDFLIIQSKALSQAVETFSPLPEPETIGLTNLVIFAIHFLHVGSTVVIQPGLKQWSPKHIIDVMREDKVGFPAPLPCAFLVLWGVFAWLVRNLNPASVADGWLCAGSL